MKLEEIQELAKKEGALLFGVSASPGLLESLKTPWARSVLVLGMPVKDRRLVEGIKYPCWEKPLQFIDLVLNQICYKLALLLRDRGLNSSVLPSSSEKIDLRFFVLDAGLGSKGKNGLILTPEFGPRVRFAGVVTNLELESTGPVEEDLCGECTSCIDACPVGALTAGGFDSQKCNEFNQKTEAQTRKLFKKCTRCTDACPIGAKLE